jgi:hypothetical protein
LSPALRWRPIEGADGYHVSSHGHVARQLANSTVRMLRAAPNDCGYLKVSLGRGRQRYVHRLVAAAFLAAPPDDGQVWTVDHIDFDLRNNAADNLRWLTLEDNSARHLPAELDAWWGRQRHRRRRDAVA